MKGQEKMKKLIKVEENEVPREFKNEVIKSVTRESWFSPYN